MRGENKGKNFSEEKKFIETTIGRNNLSLDAQYEMRGSFLEKKNAKLKTPFSRFIK